MKNNIMGSHCMTIWGVYKRDHTSTRETKVPQGNKARNKKKKKK